MSQQGTLDVERVRRHFDFVDRGRIVTNNAASTQAPRELVQLDPMASCRLSFYLYNTLDDVGYATGAVRSILAGRAATVVG